MRVGLRLGLCLVGLAGVACEESDEQFGEGGEFAETESAVYGGVAASDPAVVKVSGGCTGVLIRPGTVLTAAHCVCDKVNGVNVCPSERPEVTFVDVPMVDGTLADVEIRGTAVAFDDYVGVDTSAHASDDLAIILLDDIPRARGAVVSPIRVSNPVNHVQVGDDVRFVGFGNNSANCASGAGTRRAAQMVITEVQSPPSATTDYFNVLDSNHKICFADSGGPLFDSAGQVVGIASRSSNTLPLSHFSSTREAYQWLSLNACAGFDPAFPDANYCNDPMCLCRHGIGDCDRDTQCMGPATCVGNIGPEFGTESWVDVCIQCPTFQPGVTDWNFCATPHCPCGVGEGDCDFVPGQCESGLKCGINNGADYGLSPYAEVCIREGLPCGNGQWDSGEECDDGNRIAGDGCSAGCTVENGWHCITFNNCIEVVPPHCPPHCGL